MGLCVVGVGRDVEENVITLNRYLKAVKLTLASET